MHEHKIDLPSIVRSSEPSVLKLRMDNYGTLLTFVSMCVKRYLECCFPAQVGITTTLAGDLIATRPTWKAADFINVFRFFRQRQDLDGLKVYGNTITHARLMEMVCVYELERTREMERMLEERKGSYAQPTQRRYAESSVKSEFGRIAENIAAKQMEKRTSSKWQEVRVAPDEGWFKREMGV